jgi:hypothetical protein
MPGRAAAACQTPAGIALGVGGETAEADPTPAPADMASTMTASPVTLLEARNFISVPSFVDDWIQAAMSYSILARVREVHSLPATRYLTNLVCAISIHGWSIQPCPIDLVSHDLEHVVVGTGVAR